MAKLNLTDENKLEIAKMFIQSTTDWMVFFSERRWSVLKYSVGSMITVSGVSIFSNNSCAFLFLVLGIAISATLYLVGNRKWDVYIDSLKVRLHKSLLCFEEGVYLEGESLIPQNQEQKPTQGATSFTFIAAIWVVAVAAGIAIFAGPSKGSDSHGTTLSHCAVRV